MARISKEKQEEIRQKIKDVAKEKFSTVGFEKTSTKAIAKEVGIAEGTLFNYFDSKTEIFFESFGDDYLQDSLSIDENLKITENVTDVIFEQFQSTMGMMLKVPRGVIGELTIASVRMAKRKPEKFKRLVALDFKFIEDLASYIKRLIDNGILKPVNHHDFGEVLFAIIGYEFLLYIYDTSIKKDELLDNVRRKIDLVIKGYTKGGQND